MCDCYGHKCECCDNLVPMHIGDFNYEREEFKVWCNEHINDASKGAIIFELIDSWDEDIKGWKCAILGPEVGNINDGDNHPNVGSNWKETLIE